MEKTAEQVYTDLLCQLANPGVTQPVVVADLFREVELMHSRARSRTGNLRTPERPTPEPSLQLAARSVKPPTGLGQGKGHAPVGRRSDSPAGDRRSGDIYRRGSHQSDPSRGRNGRAFDAPPVDNGAIGSANRQTRSSEVSA
jgi:hypothetical protein